MKRRILASILTALATVSLFAGCSSKDETPSNIVTELTAPVTIDMWHYMVGTQQTVLQEIIDDFNATNGKGITVNAIAQGGISDLNKKVIAAAQSNTLPAIINVYPDVATALIEQNKLVDLTPYVDNDTIGMKDDIKNDFNKTFIDEISQWGNSKVYGIPMTKSAEVLYINRTLLEKIGYTVDDLNNLTFEKLSEISQKSKAELGIPGFGFDSSSNAFISSLKMDGKDFVTLDSKINVDNEWVKTYMDFFKQQVSDGNFRIPGEDKFLSGPFSNQQVLMYQGSSAGAGFIKTDGKFDVAVVEVPVFEGKDKAVIQQGASLFVTTDVTAEQQYAAYEFVKFATSSENTAKFAVETGYLPVRKSAADTETLKVALENTESMFTKVYPVAEKALEYAYYTPAVNNAQSARNVAAEKFDAYVSGTIKDINTFISELLSQVETSIQRQ